MEDFVVEHVAAARAYFADLAAATRSLDTATAISAACSAVTVAAVVVGCVVIRRLIRMRTPEVGQGRSTPKPSRHRAPSPPPSWSSYSRGRARQPLRGAASPTISSSTPRWFSDSYGGASSPSETEKSSSRAERRRRWRHRRRSPSSSSTSTTSSSSYISSSSSDTSLTATSPSYRRRRSSSEDLSY